MRVKRIEHVAIAVKNADKVASILQDTFGLKLDYTQDLPQYHTRIAMLPVGGTYVELLEAMSPTSDTAKWIAERGEGLYHLCLEVDDIKGALAELKAKGVTLLNDEPIVGHAGWRIAFIDPACTGNILFELAQSPDSWETAERAREQVSVGDH
jgi:methylmalonyl-CoA/ethylmalonyl-CoA epimerase